MPADDDPLLSAAEVAAALGCSVATVGNRRRAGLLAGEVSDGPGQRVFMFRKSVVDAYLAEHARYENGFTAADHRWIEAQLAKARRR